MNVNTTASTLPAVAVTLYFNSWQMPEGFCPLLHAFGLILQSSSNDCDPHEGIHEGKEGKYRLQVTQFVQRLEYWHKELTNTLVTSINVVPVNGRAVAYLGTADGRHIQVRKPRLCWAVFNN